jgi:hypothetical protein
MPAQTWINPLCPRERSPSHKGRIWNIAAAANTAGPPTLYGFALSHHVDGLD